MSKRINLGTIKEVLEIPHLLSHQLKAFEEFLQANTPPEKRKNIGLQEVFNEIFPVESIDGKYRLEFISYSLGRPRYSPQECRRRSLTYSVPLRVLFRLITPSDIKEQEIYLGDIPIMTDNASFIINGDERCVVNQLQRSSGVFFEEEMHPVGKRIYYARIIPLRGSWMEFRYDISETISCIIDRRKTFPATQILRMFGLSTNDDILKEFSDRRYPEIVNTLKKDPTTSTEEALIDFYKKMRPTEPVTLEAAKVVFKRMFLDVRRYDLGKVGRYIINRKLKLNFPLRHRVLDKQTVTETVKYLVKIKYGEEKVDDIDHLGNRRVKTTCELLQNQVRIALARLERVIRERFALLQGMENITVQHLINSKIFNAQMMSFFGTSPLSQFLDQTNPLAELTHKRRLTATGPGGVSRERAGFEVRDVHPSHYGRICPIETPEGQNIGLITSLTCYAKIGDLGFLQTPYRKVEGGKITKKIEYLTADVEEEKMIAQANVPIDEEGRILSSLVTCRHKGKFPMVPPEKVEYIDISPKQVVSVSASLIPFLEHDDANRALMGSNMQRQAVPLLVTEAPLVATGMEEKVARDSGYVVIAQEEGIVKEVDSQHIKIGEYVYKLRKFDRSNQNTLINQKPLVKVGDKVKKKQIIADGSASCGGELSLGRNLLVAFMPWRGYNFEDAIVISERLVKEDILTSIHIERFEIEARETRLGNEEITRDIPGVREEALENLDESGIVRIGAEVGPDDILVGKVSPKTEKELSPEDRLLRAIFREKAADVKDTSLRVPPGIWGVVIDVEVFERKDTKKKTRKEKREETKKLKEIEEYYSQERKVLEEEMYKKISERLNKDVSVVKRMKLEDIEEVQDILTLYDERFQELEQEKNLEIMKVKRGDELPTGVLKRVVVYVAMKRKIQVGDKLAGRHGNKGVIAKILPEEDMPYLEDGTPVDIVLNPLGVPSRMNVGQLLETHLGWAAKKLGLRFICPVFDGAKEDKIKELLKKAGLPEDGKVVLYDGYTGEPFSQKVTVGYMYIMKLIHMVDDKIHARAIGPYSLITQQPLGGKAQFGGQRFGEMEVWALEAYGAAFTLQEILTVKSDDVEGRTRIYEAIVKGEHKLHPGTPESFNVLMRELQGLCLDVRLIKEEK